MGEKSNSIPRLILLLDELYNEVCSTLIQLLSALSPDTDHTLALPQHQRNYSMPYFAFEKDQNYAHSPIFFTVL
jgi:hypothetical protein